MQYHISGKIYTEKMLSRNDFSFGSASSSHFFISHSQRIRTRHPWFRRFSIFFLSRLILSSNFLIQKSWCDLGADEYLQPCRCQKHPCTNITAFRDLNTISGLPGRSEACNLYLKLFFHNHLRTRISGLVFLLLIFDILKERFSGEWTSISE